MKHYIAMFLTFLTTLTLTAQDITGQWNGVLKVQGTQLRVVFNVSKTDNSFVSTMDSPDQGAKGIPVTNTTFKDSTITFVVANAQIEYKGTLKDEVIVGVFKQMGREFPLNLSKKAIEKEPLKRPQEPIKPYPYHSEEVTFQNAKAGISLAGTLTWPKKEGVFPAVILISGSGPQNRDEEMMGHKPFLIISDYLTKNGIAVLRYDDRGVAESTGDFKTATSADFATDVESAIAYLKTRKEIDKNKIGLIGHSEGGIIAPMVASRSKEVAFIVLLAGTGIPGDQLLLLQKERIARANGVSEHDIKKAQETNATLFKMVLTADDIGQLKTDLTHSITEAIKNEKSTETINRTTEDAYVAMQVDQLTSPWMLYFLKYDPATALEKVTCPVLAVNGEKDLQVPSDENLTAIKNALTKGGNKNVSTKEFENLNHLFQECETGSPNEYGTIEQTFSPLALAEITQWILAQTH
ncbi:MAG: alpha/beta hydrolase [Muricauda sp.]|nr:MULTISPECIES: alpha/beta fold hydrolase [unclassified Allomuricauda]MAU16123.1 alpha/beta hydrolase [Allomuricauda sp.]|tara:strand:- start:1150 stop:2547 length:1398 start_codon:yes stop_codon:yes gene_type:complete